MNYEKIRERIPKLNMGRHNHAGRHSEQMRIDARDSEYSFHVDPYLNSIGDQIGRSIHEEEIEIFRNNTVYPKKEV